MSSDFDINSEDYNSSREDEFSLLMSNNASIDKRYFRQTTKTSSKTLCLKKLSNNKSHPYKLTREPKWKKSDKLKTQQK